MDAHLLTKIIHMTAVAALMVFVLRASTLFIVYKVNNPTQQGVKL